MPAKSFRRQRELRSHTQLLSFATTFRRSLAGSPKATILLPRVDPSQSKASEPTDVSTADRRPPRGAIVSFAAAFAGACRFVGSGPDFPQIDDVQIPDPERQAR